MNTKMVSEQELDRLLRRASQTRPVDPAVLDDPSVRGALAAVRRQIEYGSPRRAPARRPVYRRRLAAVGVAAACAGVASLVGVEGLTGGSGDAGLPLAVSPAAAAALNRVAHAALGQDGLSPGQWEYSYASFQNRDSVSAGNATVTYTYASHEQDWEGANGDQRERSTNDSFRFATPRDQAAYEADKSAFPDLHYMTLSGVYSDFVGHNNQPPQPWETSPPSDPRTLISDISGHTAASLQHGEDKESAAEAHADATAPAALWVDLSRIIESATSARLRATAFAALSYVPGTKVLGSRTDQLGRSGVAVSWTDPNHNYNSNDETETLIVSRSTGQLLEEDQTPNHAEGTIPAGTVNAREVFKSYAIVDSDTALPGGGSLPIDTNAPTNK